MPKRTPAQRIFYRSYVPYIKQKVLELYPQSYMNIDTVTDTWAKNARWDDKFANEILFHAKAFFKQNISPDNEYSWDTEVLSQIIDLMIQHMLPYFIRAPQYQHTESDAKMYLETKLRTENAFYHRAFRRHKEILEKREQRRLNAEPTQSKHRRKRILIKSVSDEYNNIKYMTQVDIQHIK